MDWIGLATLVIGTSAMACYVAGIVFVLALIVGCFVEK